MDLELWQKICDDLGVPTNSFVREGPRPQGALANCECDWCEATRRYLDREALSASGSCIKDQ